MINGINERFASIRREIGLNVKEFAESLGMEPTTVSSIESGKREPSKEVLLNLAIKYAISLNWIFTGIGTKNLVEAVGTGTDIPIYNPTDIDKNGKSFVIPLLDQKLSAGSGQELPDSDDVSVLIPVPSRLAKFGKNLAALTVDGDSMYPTLDRGDMVVCDSCGWSGEGVYALRMSGEGFVKRLSKAPGKIVIISDNPKYPIREEPEGSQDFEIIGRVHCAIKNME